MSACYSQRILQVGNTVVTLECDLYAYHHGNHAAHLVTGEGVVSMRWEGAPSKASTGTVDDSHG